MNEANRSHLLQQQLQVKCLHVTAGPLLDYINEKFFAVRRAQLDKQAALLAMFDLRGVAGYRVAPNNSRPAGDGWMRCKRYPGWWQPNNTPSGRENREFLTALVRADISPRGFISRGGFSQWGGSTNARLTETMGQILFAQPNDDPSAAYLMASSVWLPKQELWPELGVVEMDVKSWREIYQADVAARQQAATGVGLAAQVNQAKAAADAG